MQSIKVSSFKFQLDKENIKVSFISQENINDNNSVARTQSLKMLQLLELVYMGTQREDETFHLANFWLSISLSSFNY